VTTYYCDPSGNNGNPGTEAEPWQTVAYAVTAVSAGDTVIYEDGTYPVTSSVSSWTSGTSGNIVTHQARNSRLAIWEQSAYGFNPIVLAAESYITFDGIKMRQDVMTSIGKFLHLDGCGNITIDDCEIYNTSPHCLMIEDGCTNITVQNCSFHADTSTVGVGRNGILIYGTTANTDILIENCTMYDIPHTGISNNVNCSSSDTYIIRSCTIYSNDSHGISVKKGTIKIYDNVIYDAGGQGPRNNDRKGIRVTADATADVYNNVVYDCTGSGIGITSDVDTVNVWNNTVENCNDVGDDFGSIGVVYRTDYAQGSIEIQNNIIYHTQSGRRCFFADTSAEGAITTMDYNLWYDSTAEETMRRNGTTYGTFATYQAAGYEPNSVMSDNPDFTDQANHDFTLQVGSPAIDAGVNVGLPYNGTAPDIGYWESDPTSAETSTVGGQAIIKMTTSATTAMQSRLQDISISSGGIMYVDGAHIVIDGAHVVVG
jgi:hypothetical protein